MYNILCFGDSITYGEFDVASGGWVDRLKRFGFNHFISNGRDKEIKVTNLGISGEDTTQALKRVEQEIIPRLDKDLKTIIIFAYGANDDAYFPTTNTYQNSPEQFSANLKELIATAQKYTDTIYFLAITPVIDVKNSTPNHRGKIRSNKIVAEYNLIIEKVAKENSAHYIKLSNFPTTENLFCEDGLHPNDNGHKIIYENVLIALNKIL